MCLWFRGSSTRIFSAPGTCVTCSIPVQEEEGDAKEEDGNEAGGYVSELAERDRVDG